MAILNLPHSIRFEDGERPNEGKLVMEPFHPGYGTTIGNALRRVLLSSLEGAAVVAVKIKGVTHEFQAMEGVKEDVLEIILNIKGLRLKLHSDQPVTLKLNVKGAKVVTGADIEANADVDITNPEMKVCTITGDDTEFDMEIVVARGRGYITTEERGHESYDLGTIAVDALFSPIRNVGYKVENTRVGDITNYDKLVLTIETDGTVSPEDAVHQSAKLLIDHFMLLVAPSSEIAGS
ncbi:DNA-directed RNA polymerase subunit alpha [Candidatus Uhrbacteria bacterium]|nr:DNA-directed RNA polymerase subunit alpha [Candidatus Uhrbacteria bacterium]